MRISDWSSDVCSSDLWLMTEIETELFGMRVTGNAGIRFARTDQSSSGFNSGSFVTVDRSYEDWLPSFNLNQIGRASCRERVCQYVYISVVAVTLKKKNMKLE